MTHLENLFENRKWITRMMATHVDDLPGTLTHAKVATVAAEVEAELCDFLATQNGAMVYLDPDTRCVYPLTHCAP